MKRLILVAALLAAPAAFGEPQEGPSPEGGSGFPGVDVHEDEASGIQNWWSWDFGDHCKDGHHRHRPPPFGYALVNFAIFFAVMMKLAGKPLRDFVAERHDGIKRDLDEAAKLRKAAEAQLAEYGKRVERVDQEVDQLLAEIRKEAEAEKARLIAAAEEQAKRIKEDAQKQINAEIERARLELRRGVIEAATKAADELLKKQVGSDDQRKMAERYVGDLEKQTTRRTA
jgi:ATP synthase F0 subunit b